MSDLEDLVRGLGAMDRPTQRQACDEALARLREQPELRTRLLDLLKEGTPLLQRFGAAWVLFHDRPTLGLLPALLAALELPHGDLRWTAAQLLAVLGRTQGEVLPVLLHEIAAGPSPQRRRMAIYAGRELAPERPETARALLAALDDTDPEVRRAALTSVAKLVEPGSACLERTLTVLGSDPDPRMRRIAAAVLPALAATLPESADRIGTALEQAALAADPGLARAAQAASSRVAALPSP